MVFDPDGSLVESDKPGFQVFFKPLPAVRSRRRAGPVAVENVVDGDHFTFLRSSGVPMLASQIDEFLRRVAAPRTRVATT